jgi:hypothetical protein
MAWVLVGSHKINTALVCYAEQEGETVRVYFHGEWEGNPIDLHFDEAKALWKYLKAEDVMMGKDKGSSHVIPKSGPATNTGMYDMGAVKEGNAEKPKPPSAPTPVQHKPGEAKKH